MMGGSFPLFFEDLSPCMYVASSLAEGEKLKAVGWLAAQSMQSSQWQSSKQHGSRSPLKERTAMYRGLEF